MNRFRRAMAVVLLVLAAALPMQGCTGQGAQGAGAFCSSLVQLALGVGVSVGSYFLIKEIS